MTTGGSRPWPGTADWGGDWVGQTVGELAHLGFELREGGLPGTIPGPRLLVAFRPQPTLEHFDPELVTYWEARDGRGRVAELAPGGEHPVHRSWSWGPIRVTDRVPVSNQFLSFGGTLLVDSVEGPAGATTYAAFVSRAPIVRWAGHSQGVDPLVDEIGAFFARLMVPVDYQEGAEAKIADADPEAVYALFLAHSLERIHRSSRLRDADPQVAGWVQHEGHRLAHDAPAHWADGQELLAWLELG